MTTDDDFRDRWRKQLDRYARSVTRLRDAAPGERDTARAECEREWQKVGDLIDEQSGPPIPDTP